MSNPRVQANREFVRAVKMAGRCADCGRTAPQVGGVDQMQFIRHNGSQGEPIGTMVSRGRTRTSIERAIADCDLVCADHALERAKQRGRVA